MAEGMGAVFARGDGLWRRRFPTERAVRRSGVLVAPQFLGEDFRLAERMEDLNVEQFISELATEAFTVATLPWAPSLDEEGLDDNTPKPVAHSVGDELGVII